MADSERLRKSLSRNDVGATGSHQVGILVPKAFRRYFPTLDEVGLNPDAWLDVSLEGAPYRWRFIHYNNGVVGDGTRDEYRLTHVTASLRATACAAGDVLELERTDRASYTCRVLTTESDPGMLVLSTAGPWRMVSVRRSA